MSKKEEAIETKDLSNGTQDVDTDDFAASVLKENPWLAEDKEIQSLLEKKGAAKKEPKTTEVVDDKSKVKPENKEETETVAAEAEGQEEETEETEEESESTEENHSPFFKNKVKKFEISSHDEAFDLAKKKYSIDIKDPKNFNTFFNSVDKWRADAQRANDINKRYEETVNGINSLPKVLQDGIQAFAKGENYLDVLNNPASRIDFNKKIDDNDLADIVNYYFLEDASELQEDLESKKITQEEFNKGIDNLYKASKKIYEKDRSDFQNQKKVLAEQAKEQTRKFSESVEDSVATLTQQYPDFGDTELNKVKSILSKGDLLSHFYNQDGSLKKEAAKLVAFMLYGESEINKQTKKAASKAASEATQEIVSRADTKPRKSTTATQNKVEEKAKKVLEQYSVHLPSTDPFANAFQINQKQQ